MMMRRGALYAVLSSFLVFPVAALGQPTETGETGLLTIPNTRTLDPGKVSLGGFFRTNIESDKVFEPEGQKLRDTSVTLGEFVAGVGILNGVELSVQVPYMSFRNELPNKEKDVSNKFGDVRITPKFRLFPESESTMPFGFAFLGSVELQTGTDQFPVQLDRNSAFGNDQLSGEVMAIVDKNLFTLPGNVPAVLSLNIGGLFPSQPDVFRLDRQTEPVFAQLRRKGFPDVNFRSAVIEYGAGLQLPLWKNHIGQLDLTAEYRANNGTIEEVDDFQAILGGLRYMLVNGWAAHGGLDVGLSNSVEHVSVLAGLSYTGPQPPRPSGAVVKEKIVYRDRVIQVEKIPFGDVNFEFDKANLTDVGRGRVYLIAQKLKEGKNVKIEIQGHTDYIGTEDYNKALGLKRAETVKAELVRLGVDPSRISTVSFGESKPLIDLQTPWARAVNRRAEFVVVGEPTQSSQSQPAEKPSGEAKPQ